jgi:acetate kinase
VIHYLPNFSINETFHNHLKRGQSGIISTDTSPYIAVIPTNEELLIAKDADTLRREL